MQRAAGVELIPSGRERELSMLLKAHDEARERGATRFAFLSGPPGIGKSHLFDLCRHALTDRGARVFEGRPSRAAARAYGLFTDVIPALIGYLSEVGVPARTVAELARRTAPLAGHLTGAGTSPDQQRLDLFDAVAELFALAGRGTPVFLLSDADAADRASLELLRYLAAASLAPGARGGGLFVVSVREDASTPPLLVELLARTPATRIPLQGLDLEGIRAFLSRRDLAERLLDATGGLPVALEEALSANRPTDLFSHRLGTMAAPVRDVLLALAVFGQPADAPGVAALLAGLNGAVSSDPTERLDRLVRERLVDMRIIAGQARYSLAREPEREKLLSAARDEEKQRLHLAAGELLEETDVEAAARHFLTSDPAGRGAAAAEKAAETLLGRFAFEEAADLFREALLRAPVSERSRLNERLGTALASSHDYLPALRHVGLARKGRDPEGRRALRAEAARLTMLMGRLATAERLVQTVLASALPSDLSDAAGVRAFVDCAEVLFLRGRYDEAQTHCERGLDAWAGSTGLVLALRNTLGKVHLNRAALDEAGRAFELNTAEARAAGLAREEARGLINQGVVAHRQGDHRRAIALYRDALAKPGADRALSALALSNLGSLYADSGELEPAVDHLSRALSAFTRARRLKEVAHCALNLGRLHLFLGELERAQELCAHAEATANEVGDPYLRASANLLGGEILEATGTLADAARQVTLARAAFEALKSPRYAAEASLLLARIHLARGERSLCANELDRPVVDEAARSNPRIAVERDLLAGELALSGRELAEATRRLSSAKDQLIEAPDLEGPWRVYHLLSTLRLAAGDAHGAAADASRSARLLEELADRVPVALRAGFLNHPRRAAVLAGAERELSPSSVRRALSLAPVAPALHGLIGEAPSLTRVLKALDPVGRSNATVLIRGESGTGKELLAEALHRKSPRRDMPLVKVNCAAMVEELLLSELFGHEKGAFTGAVRERKGRFELAEGGTIFLDEIGDISPKCQVSLLRVLQERELERVGGTKTVKVDVRVLCATNRDLEAMVASGHFRQDLYYRIKGVMLELPPLRERSSDLPGLCDHFLARFARERSEEQKTLSPEALRLLQAHSWPGNIRELENVMSSASIFSEGTIICLEALEHVAELAVLARSMGVDGLHGDEIEEDDENFAPLPSTAHDSEVDYFDLARRQGLSLKDLRQHVEVQCIRRALGEARGNISEAARLLKVTRSRLSQIVNENPLLRAAANGD